MHTRSDEELVQAIQNGDVLAYEQLVVRYQRRLFAFAFRILGKSAPAEEVVQDTLFAVYKAIDRIDTQRKFSTYVFEITKRTAISYLRKQKKTISLDESVTIDEDESMYEDLYRIEKHGRVRQALASLSQKYQNVIRLYYFDELSYDEMSQKLKLPINTIRTHLYRAKSELAKLLHYENT